MPQKRNPTGMYKFNKEGKAERWIVKPDDLSHLCMYRPINGALEFWCGKCEENVTPESKVKTRDVWCPKCKGSIVVRCAEKATMADWMEEPDNGDNCLGATDPNAPEFTFDSDHSIRDMTFWCSNRDCVHSNHIDPERKRRSENLTVMHTEPYGAIHCPACGNDALFAELSPKLEKEVFGCVS